MSLKMDFVQQIRQAPQSLHLNHMKLNSSHVVAITLLIPALHFIYLDYLKYLALGPGGTPPTITGYLRVKSLGLFALSNPYEPPQIPAHLTHKQGRLTSLPSRSEPRPRTAGIAPHRQLNQNSTAEIFSKLSDAIKAIARDNKDIEEGTSCFEKHGPGLFSTCPLRRTCRGEICHAHPSDGSMHLTLHPSDAKLMLEAGWGERHPLARGGWLERFVPAGFVMVYAPRTEIEIEVVLQLVRASAWWVAGTDLKTPDWVRRDSGAEANDVLMQQQQQQLKEKCDGAFFEM